MISILRDKNNKTNRIKYLSLTILIDRVLKFRDYFLAFISSLSKLDVAFLLGQEHKYFYMICSMVHRAKPIQLGLSIRHVIRRTCIE